MPRKTIDDARHELRLVTALREARKEALSAAEAIAREVAAMYPVDVFPPPGDGATPEQFAAGGARHASTVVADRIRDLRRRQ